MRTLQKAVYSPKKQYNFYNNFMSTEMRKYQKVNDSVKHEFI